MSENLCDGCGRPMDDDGNHVHMGDGALASYARYLHDMLTINYKTLKITENAEHGEDRDLLPAMLYLNAAQDKLVDAVIMPEQPFPGGRFNAEVRTNEILADIREHIGPPSVIVSANEGYIVGIDPDDAEHEHGDEVWFDGGYEGLRQQYSGATVLHSLQVTTMYRRGVGVGVYSTAMPYRLRDGGDIEFLDGEYEVDDHTGGDFAKCLLRQFATTTN